uniref:Uncharacterized protein n=1 Tax=Anopheles coluzzii TaxID=1518534 RepID=A0A8W7PM66_ANOCL
MKAGAYRCNYHSVVSAPPAANAHAQEEHDENGDVMGDLPVFACHTTAIINIKLSWANRFSEPNPESCRLFDRFTQTLANPLMRPGDGDRDLSDREMTPRANQAGNGPVAKQSSSRRSTPRERELRRFENCQLFSAET